MPAESRASDAGNTTGFWNLTSRAVRQYRPHAFATGCPETRDVQMGAALHRKMADSADSAGRWNHNREEPGHPSGWCGQSDSVKSVHALRVRSLDNADAPRPPLVSVCR